MVSSAGIARGLICLVWSGAWETLSHEQPRRGLTPTKSAHFKPLPLVARIRAQQPNARFLPARSARHAGRRITPFDGHCPNVLDRCPAPQRRGHLGPRPRRFGWRSGVRRRIAPECRRYRRAAGRAPGPGRRGGRTACPKPAVETKRPRGHLEVAEDRQRNRSRPEIEQALLTCSDLPAAFSRTLRVKTLRVRWKRSSTPEVPTNSAEEPSDNDPQRGA